MDLYAVQSQARLRGCGGATNQIEVAECIFQLQRKQIWLEGDQEQGTFADCHFTQDAIFFEYLITDKRSPGHPEDREFMIGLAFLTDFTNLLYTIEMLACNDNPSQDGDTYARGL